MIQALLFDFDGLLVDTETPAFESWQTIYAEYGQELSLNLWKEALGTTHGFDALTHLASLTAIDSAAIALRRQEMKHALSSKQPLLPGVRAILDQAHAMALPCAVASSSSREWVEGWLTHHHLRSDFACVRTANDVARTKPAPDLFLSAATCLHIAPQNCLVFEDSPNGLLAARAAGMRVVAVPGAISRQISLPPADLVIERLDSLPLASMLQRICS